MGQEVSNKKPKQTRYQKLLAELDDVPCQVNWITFVMGDHPPDPMEDVIDEDEETLYKALDLEVPQPPDDDLSYRERQDETWEDLKWKRLGWLVCAAATPVKRRYDASDKHSFFSWGYTYTGIFAAKTIEDLLEKVLTWAKSHEVKVEPRTKKKKKKKKESKDAT